MKFKLNNKIIEIDIIFSFIIIGTIGFVLFPIIIFGAGKLDNNMKDFAIISIVNLICILVPIFVFKKLIRVQLKTEIALIALCIIQFSILPQIFYKAYKENPDSYSFENRFVNYVKNENKEKITNNDSLFLKNRHYFDSLFAQRCMLKELPRDRDTIIKLDKKTMVLCPTEEFMNTGNGIVHRTLRVRVYNIMSGFELFSFLEDGASLNSSYSLYLQNLKYKTTIVNLPETGINYFDFWLAAITGFNTSEIIPISTFTRTLSKIVLGLNILLLGLILGQLNIFNISKKQK